MLDKHQDICDVVSLLVYSYNENSFLLTQDKSTQEIWLPSINVGGKSWSEAARQLIDDLRLPVKVNKICQLIRIWKPQKDMVYHVIFLIKVSKDLKLWQGIVGSKIFWANTRDIKTSYTSLRSPEILDFVSTALNVSVHVPQQLNYSIKIETLSLWSTLIDKELVSEVVEILEDHVLLREESVHKKTMDSVGYTVATQISIYNYFLTLCFPCMYMNLRLFSVVIEKLGWDRSNATRLFVTADIESKGFLSYRDFLYFIAVTDPNMKHGVIGTDIRSRYIFNHYDIDNDRLLDFNEVKGILNDLRGTRVKNSEASSLAKDVEFCAKVLGIEPRQPTDVERFVKALNTPRAKGTTVLLRALRSINNYLPKVTDKSPMKSGLYQSELRIPPAVPQMVHFKGQKEVQDYSVAVHFIKLKKNGSVVEKIWDVENVMSETSLSTCKTGLKNSPSMETFNHLNVHFEVLRGLEYFEKEIALKEAQSKQGKKTKPAFNWGMVDPTGFAKCVMKVSEAVTNILKGEPRLLELSSPVFVLGDLHGNFSDLLRFEKALWPLGPTLSSSTLLVLGDYVDRGPHSVELMAHLFAYKLQCPSKVMLLRGNHEIRAVQRMFTFHQECCHKFGQKLGNEVWESVNKALDCLPLAAVIDNKVFCSHGGIPPPWLCPTISAINTIPCPLPKPDEQSPLAWDVMWNDPLNSMEGGINLEMELSANEGFAFNSHRGTGHCFSTQALNNFLKANNLSVLLRAHQMHERGFYVQMSHKMETVFSAANYGAAKNEPACILVDSGRLRAFRVEHPS